MHARTQTHTYTHTHTHTHTHDTRLGAVDQDPAARAAGGGDEVGGGVDVAHQVLLRLRRRT